MTELASLIRQLSNPYLSRHQQAELRCQIAKRLEEAGDYEGAREALDVLWSGLGQRSSQIDVLEPAVAAEVLLRVGTLTGWLGQANQVNKDAQEAAKNLITEAAVIFESLAAKNKVLEAKTELAYCYWREGGYDEARVTLKGVIEQLTGDSELKAKAVLRSAIVEWSSLRYSDALCILTQAAPLFGKIQNHTVKGGYHDALAGVLVNLGAAEHREDYTDRAFVEYEAAGYHFEQAGHQRYRANVENNLGFLYFKVNRYEDAHRHLDRARRILVRLKDTGTVAQVDETRARVFLSEGQYTEAERAAGTAVRALEQSGRQSLLAEALTAHGTALARLGYGERARLTLSRAVETAHLSGAPNIAGLAALATAEELSKQLAVDELQAVYLRAWDWLAGSQDLQTIQRLLKAARLVISTTVSREVKERPEARPQGTLKEQVRAYERELIRRALRDAEGSVTQAARLLGISYQLLSQIIKTRHKDLSRDRTPAKKRRRSIFKKKKRH